MSATADGAYLNLNDEATRLGLMALDTELNLLHRVCIEQGLLFKSISARPPATPCACVCTMRRNVRQTTRTSTRATQAPHQCAEVGGA